MLNPPPTPLPLRRVVHIDAPPPPQRTLDAHCVAGRNHGDTGDTETHRGNLGRILRMVAVANLDVCRTPLNPPILQFKKFLRASPCPPCLRGSISPVNSHHACKGEERAAPWGGAGVN
jgi:hypothetical protein